MKFIFADLSKLTVNQLMVRMRKQFACSLGLFFLLSIHFIGGVFLTGERPQHDMRLHSLGTLAVMELLVWGSFARAWNELARKNKEDSRTNGQAI